MFTRRALRSYRITSMLVMGLLLFAQSVYAVQSCVTPHRTPVMAFAQDKMADCGGANHAGAANCCLQQCLQSDQVHGQAPLLALDMPPALPLLIVTRAEDIAAWHADIFERLDASPTGPPASIKFCSLRL